MCNNFNLLQSSHESLLQSGIYVNALFYGIFEIFVGMYFANEITFESNQLSYCLFESNWMEQSQPVRKCVVFACEVLKKPQELLILIYPMNLGAFTTVCLF